MSLAQLQRGFLLRDVVVEPQRQRIVRDGEAVHIEPRVMQVLVELAANTGAPVNRADLLDAVWSDVVVGDEVLSRAVSILRQALGDERTDPRFIRTIPRQGYELIAPLEPLPQNRSALSPRLDPRWFSIGVGVIGVALLTLTWVLWPASPEDRILVLMPIKVDSEQLGGTAAGLNNDLYELIGQSKGLKSLGKRWSFGLRDTSLPPQDIAEQFGASYLLEGALDQADNQLQLYLEIIELPRGASLWWREFSAPDARTLTEAALAQTRRGLNDVIGAGIDALPQGRGPVAEGAYQAYLAARHHWSLRGEEHINEAARLLERAIALDDGFARARLALAQVYALEPFYSDAEVETGFANARVHLSQAVAADESLRYESNALEGFMRLRSRDWAGAEQILSATLAADPDNALAHYTYAMLKSALGEAQTGLAHAQRAAELDPTSPVVRDRLAINYLWVNDTAAAGDSFAAAQRLGYTEGVQSKAYIVYLIRTGRLEELSSVLLRLGMPPDWVASLGQGLSSGVVTEGLITATEQAIAAGHIPRELVFGAWVMLGQPDRAVAAFDFSFKSPDVELIWSAEAQMLRQAAGFEQLLEQLGLVEHYKKHIINQ